MKTIPVLVLALAALVPVHAQILRPSTFGGAGPGGHDSRGHNEGWNHHGHYGYGAGPRYFGGWGHSYYYGYGGLLPAVYWGAPAVYSDGGYGYDYAYDVRPDYRSSGFWLGGLVGAIIGNNSGSLASGR